MLNIVSTSLLCTQRHVIVSLLIYAILSSNTQLVNKRRRI